MIKISIIKNQDYFIFKQVIKNTRVLKSIAEMIALLLLYKVE